MKLFPGTNLSVNNWSPSVKLVRPGAPSNNLLLLSYPLAVRRRGGKVPDMQIQCFQLSDKIILAWGLPERIESPNFVGIVASGLKHWTKFCGYRFSGIATIFFSSLLQLVQKCLEQIAIKPLSSFWYRKICYTKY